METNITNPKSDKSKYPDLVHLIFLLVGVVVGSILSVTTTISFIQDNKQTETINEPDSNLISKHYLNANSKTYENIRLGYKIDYPRGITKVYDCPDYPPCALIDDFSIRLEPLEFYSEEEILEADLYCSADGVGGFVRCENPQISEYINPHGIKGFIVKRLRIIKSQELDGYNVVDTEPERFNETAYVFPINGDSKYKSILLSTDIPNDGNLEKLKNIADSFRLVD